MSRFLRMHKIKSILIDENVACTVNVKPLKSNAQQENMLKMTGAIKK